MASSFLVVFRTIRRNIQDPVTLVTLALLPGHRRQQELLHQLHLGTRYTRRCNVNVLFVGGGGLNDSLGTFGDLSGKS